MGFPNTLHWLQNPDTHCVQFSLVLKVNQYPETQLPERPLGRLTVCNSQVFLGSSLRDTPRVNLTRHCTAWVSLSSFCTMRMTGRAQWTRARGAQSLCSLQPWRYLSQSSILRADGQLLGVITAFILSAPKSTNGERTTRFSEHGTASWPSEHFLPCGYRA